MNRARNLRRLRRTLAIALLLPLAAGFAWYERGRSPAPIELGGNVDIRDVNLSFRVGGRLASLAVDEGATVAAGDTLGRLDDEPFVNALREAEAALAVATARSTLYHEGYRKEDVEQARARLVASEAVLKNTNQTLARERQLITTGATARRGLDDAQAARDRAAADVEVARQAYTAFSRGYRAEEVAEATAEVARAEARLDGARLQLTDTELVAPAAGVVLTRAVEPGTMLAAGATVLTLSLTEPVWIRAYVSETALGRVPPGTAVRIHTDARPDRPYRGVIGFVSPTAEFTPKHVETAELRTALVYRLRVIVTDPDPALRQGMPVSVRLAAP